MEFVQIYKTWNEQKAEMMKQLLADFGFDCYLSSHSSRSVHPIPVDGLGEIRIMVPELRAKEAIEVLEGYFNLNEENLPNERNK